MTTTQTTPADGGVCGDAGVGRSNDRRNPAPPPTVVSSTVRAPGATGQEDTRVAQWWIHVDNTGIQRYVYASRTLLDGIGRAAQIDDLTDPAWLTSHRILGPGQRIVHRGAGAITIAVDHPDDLDLAGSVDSDRQHRGADTRAVPEAVRAVVARYTRAVYDVSDVLTPVVAIQTVDDPDDPVDALVRAPRLLAAARHTTAPHLAGAVPQGGLICPITGGPAEMVLPGPDGGAGVPITRAAAAARARGARWHAERQERWLGAAPLPAGPVFALPVHIDALGRTEGVSSHVAVMVIDVNDLADTLAYVDPGRAAAVSDALRGLADGMVQAMIDRVAAAVDLRGDPPPTHSAADTTDPDRHAGVTPWVAGAPAGLEFPLHRARDTGDDIGDDGKWLLPIRPWVTAGDDVVLVCESRIAWSLADAVITWLDTAHTAAADPDDPRTRLRTADTVFDRNGHLNVTVGIGIAVVPVGYSLAAGHDLAAGLCAHAKATRRAHTAAAGHVVDWHRGVADPVTVHGERTRTRSGGLRPYHSPPAGTAATPTATWTDLITGLDPTRATGLRGTATWSGVRSWIKTDLLAAALDPATNLPYDLTDAVETKIRRHLALTGTDLPTPKPPPDLPAPTWATTGTVTVDLIDLLDDHLTLTDRRTRDTDSGADTDTEETR